jgi:hypothetical protein
VVQHLYTVGNQRWVIQGGRKRGVGDLLGDARIERIEDSASSCGKAVRWCASAVRRRHEAPGCKRTGRDRRLNGLDPRT